VEKREGVDGAEGVMRRTLVTFFWCEYTFSRSGPVARGPGGELHPNPNTLTHTQAGPSQWCKLELRA
jgi:hypothetical protein